MNGWTEQREPDQQLRAPRMHAPLMSWLIVAGLLGLAWTGFNSFSAQSGDKHIEAER